MSELAVRRSVAIHAPAKTTWRVLTDNTFIPQYMFGCIAETDWQPGSPLLWKGAADGELYVKGAIVTFDAPRLLRYTTIDPNNPEVPDLPENYLTMSFIIREEKTGCRLEMVADGFNTVAKGAERYQEVNAGDDSLLLAIKGIAEKLTD
jgi:uncharacterized protein YndB with AHSA1/START domain